MIEIHQRDTQRATGPDRPDHLPLRLALPGRHVEQACLGIDAGHGQQLRVHHEPPGQQDRRHGEHGQDRLDGHHHRDQDTQVHLGEVAEQRLPVERDIGHPGGGIGQLHHADEQELMQQPAGDLSGGDPRDPGQDVSPGPRGDSGEGAGNGVEHGRRDAVGQPDGGPGEHAPVHHPAVHPPLREGQQRSRDRHGVHRRQQDRHREHPRGEEIPDQAALQVGEARGGQDRDRAAGQQQEEFHQVTRPPGGLNRRRHEQREGQRGYGADVGPQRPWQPPPRPVPGRPPPHGQLARGGQGSHVPPSGDETRRVCCWWALTVGD
jgi:hypothetical protein